MTQLTKRSQIIEEMPTLSSWEIARIAKANLFGRRIDASDRTAGARTATLKGDRVGQHSIRINDRYRVCFVWDNGDAFEVEIVDYH